MKHDLTDIPPLSQTDKLCLAVLAGAFLVPHLACWAMDEAAIRAAEAADEPPAITAAAPAIDVTPLVEAVEVRREELYWEEVPLDQACQTALQEACEEHSVPVWLALGVIQVESGFDPEAVSREGSYGLCQLNPKYFPGDLSPADNIRAGVAYLGQLLEKYDGDTAAALTSYNAGHDTGSRKYARAVLAASEKWGNG